MPWFVSLMSQLEVVRHADVQRGPLRSALSLEIFLLSETQRQDLQSLRVYQHDGRFYAKFINAVKAKALRYGVEPPDSRLSETVNGAKTA